MLSKFTKGEPLAKVKTANNLRHEPVDVTQREQDAFKSHLLTTPDNTGYDALVTSSLLPPRPTAPTPTNQTPPEQLFQPAADYEPNQGLDAYRNLHIWYNGVTRQ